MAASAKIEHFVVPATKYVPNNELPVLVYKNAMPFPVTEQTVTEVFESNGWERKGLWPGAAIDHFHPNTHECYGVVSGKSTMLLGKGEHDSNDAEGHFIDLVPGDVIVIPAGVAHMNHTYTQDYRYIGVYPKGSPKWESYRCDDPSRVAEFKKQIKLVPRPSSDPVEGLTGWLVKLWAKADTRE